MTISGHVAAGFEPVRDADFPTLRLGVQAGRAGGAAAAVFNAANEAAVANFLDERLRFADIPRVIESALAALGGAPAGSGRSRVKHAVGPGGLSGMSTREH